MAEKAKQLKLGNRTRAGRVNSVGDLATESNTAILFPGRTKELLVNSNARGWFRFYNPCAALDHQGHVILAMRYCDFTFCSKLSQVRFIFGPLTSKIFIAVAGPRYHLTAPNLNLRELKLDANIPKSRWFRGFEDPRLFCGKTNVFCLTSFRNKENSFKLLLATLDMFFLSTSEAVLPKNQVVLQADWLARDEKNWLIFKETPARKLLAVYSVFPHVIVEIDPTSGQTKKAFETSHGLESLRGARGSCNPIGIGNQYLAVAHFRQGHMFQHVFYTFSTRSPYEITGVSRKFIFNRQRRGSFSHIEFAMALVLIGQNIHITYGESDCYCKVAIAPLNNILKMVAQV